MLIIKYFISILAFATFLIIAGVSIGVRLNNSNYEMPIEYENSWCWILFIRQ